ncbi:TonB-dependent receptor [Luteimonas sp. FXH3W]|uniref:TonB-dependent receptor n=1 Tax=Aquilutibacter rugosus TaxID=3115820 RepID=A0ABU7UW52_9GAMM
MSAISAPVRAQLTLAIAMALVSPTAIAQAQNTTTADSAATATATADADKAAAEKTTKVGTVKVQGASDTDERRNESVSKIIYKRDDLLKQGDTSIFDVLKRLPGVSQGGRGGGPRMRGLGGGYTQILVDGQAQGSGFNLSQIAPEMIERIEVIPSATAENSTRAVAGTINVVLRKNLSRSQRKLSAFGGTGGGRDMGGANITFSNSTPTFGYNVMLGTMAMDSETQSSSEERRFDDNGNLIAQRLNASDVDSSNRGLMSMTRLNWTFPSGDSMAFQMMANVGKSESVADVSYLSPVGAQAAIPYSVTETESKSRGARPSLEYTHPFGDAGTFSTRVGLEYDKSKSTSPLTGYDVNHNLLIDRYWVSENTSRGIKNNGKIENTIAKKHKVSTGWEFGTDDTEQVRNQWDTPVGQATSYFTDKVNVKINRAAVFAQDEFPVSKDVSAYLGLRWEGSKTYVNGLQFGSFTNSTSVLSPIANLLWRLPGKERDQIRVGLARTYNQPGSSQLIPRATPSIDGQNSVNSPLSTGNPQLRPELSMGLDVAYEHYFGKTGFMGLSAYYRDIDDAITNIIQFDNSMNLWVSRPENAGTAKAWGATAEAKFPLRALLPTGPDMDIRSNLSWNRSRVSYWSAPYNALASQTPLTGNFGFDWRPSSKMTLGSDLSYNQGRTSRTSDNSIARTWSIWNLDAFVTYKFTPKLLLRASANNLLPKDEHNYAYSDLPVGYSERDSWSNNYRSYRLMFEYKF